VDNGQQGSQGAIDQRAVDDDINVPQSIAMHREPNRERDEEKNKGECCINGQQGKWFLYGREKQEREDVQDQETAKSDGDTKDDPLRLLLLLYAGNTPVTIDLCNQRTTDKAEQRQSEEEVGIGRE